ncbi:MAG: Phenylalanine--tRNA ligase beta subunit [Candidatus Ordinivivax streblomastigis]|uniref:Phenylalanine--tRNA ligase beta subunit n=1 Tax=Candidatus Ordinivivax streblomastigis TaxID=2540710 RepID=A0A5M8P0F5_9BACT|nr:MAG: Phenylalanine--tRNA ligase beta subunit [Candidatus Ordinivivax streblomastigis]
MNISYNWLKEYLSFDLTPQQLSDALTSIGLETGGIEEVETIKGGLKGLAVGHVLTCEAHPNSDHLHVTTVDLGNGEPLQIVCGAPNVAAGQKVIVATIGATLYAGDESLTIKKSKIRGVESNGMICAEDEIGIGTSHDGIIVLPSEVQAGTPASVYYKVESDAVLEVDITPNRVDAASHYGVARDLAAYLNTISGKQVHLQKPSVEGFKIEDPTPAVSVSVENIIACPRYSGVTIQNITVKESPAWLKNRLEAIGLRSINNVVDVTNYILHETGQALHAFDVKAIKGGKVIVKTLPSGTLFVTLDGVERKLSDQDLMICNADGAMCIGGVFGGLDSGVTELTTDVFLESAYFNPTWIRKTARYHGLNTDASFRFERGADPNHTLYVLKRAALLIKEVAGGVITGEIQDIYPHPIERPVVELSLQKVSNLVGKQIPETVIEGILNSLEIAITTKNGDVWTLNIPTYRVDVTRDVDVIEDILRIYGYNNVEIGEEVKSTLSYQTPTDRSYELQNIVSEQLTGAGFNEILNNSLTAGNYYEGLTAFPKVNCVLLRNPLSADLDVMRQSLLFGGLESIAYNRNRKNPDLKFYEFGNTYFHLPERLKDSNYLTAIKEEFKLALWVTGHSVTNSWIRPAEKSSVYELKAYVENVLLRLGVSKKKLVYNRFDNDVFSSALSIETVSGKTLGVLGVVKKSICKKFDITVEVYFAELCWDALLKENKNAKIKQSELSKFQPVRRDLALLLDAAVSFSEIEKVAYQTDKKLLKELSLFDVYEGKNLLEGKKSYAVSFILQDEEKTLNDKQIDNLMSRLQKELEVKLNAQLR